jgi:hypothetical protein
MKTLILLFAATLSFAQTRVGLLLGANDSLQGLAGTASALTYTIFGSTASGTQAQSAGILAQGQLGTSNATLFSVPTQTTATVTLIQVANTTASAVSGVKLSINGSGATAANQLLSSVTIPANGFATFTGDTWQIRDSSGGTPAAASLGGCASIVAASAAIVNSETRVTGCTVAANAMLAGTTYRITAAGRITTSTSPGNDTFNVRVGPTTLTGNVAAVIAAAANASITNQKFYLEFLVTVRTIGASGTVVGQGVVWSEDATTGAFTAPNVVGITTTAVAVDTTVANQVELDFVSGAATSSATFQNAAIEVVKL